MTSPLILLIEGDPELRAVLTAFLTQANYNVIAVASVRDAIHRLRQHLVPRIVLLDLPASRSDPYEYVSSLRENPGARNTPLVLYSSRLDGPVLARRFYASGYLSKSASPSAMLALLDAVIRDPKPRETLVSN